MPRSGCVSACRRRPPTRSEVKSVMRCSSAALSWSNGRRSAEKRSDIGHKGTERTVCRTVSKRRVGGRGRFAGVYTSKPARTHRLDELGDLAKMVKICVFRQVFTIEATGLPESRRLSRIKPRPRWSQAWSNLLGAIKAFPNKLTNMFGYCVHLVSWNQ